MARIADVFSELENLGALGNKVVVPPPKAVERPVEAPVARQERSVRVRPAEAAEAVEAEPTEDLAVAESSIEEIEALFMEGFRKPFGEASEEDEDMAAEDAEEPQPLKKRVVEEPPTNDLLETVMSEMRELEALGKTLNTRILRIQKLLAERD